MVKERQIDMNTLVNSYLELSKDINSNTNTLINKKGSDRQKARVEHSNYLCTIEGLEKHYVGSIESYYHTDIALLTIKQNNVETVGRARQVCLDSFNRYEQVIVSIEDRARFHRTIKLAWLSISIAVVSVIVPVLASYLT